MASRNANLVVSGINGELRVGDIVISIDEDYSYLVGTIIDISKFGTLEHQNSNVTDDVYVDFSGDNYSFQRKSEIEMMFSDLYDEYKPYNELPIDEVIMSPDMLIDTSIFEPHEFEALHKSEEAAKELCNRVIADNGFIKGESTIDTKSKITEEHLYSPLRFYLHNPREEEKNGEDGIYDLFDNRYEISDVQASEHMDAIELAIRRDRDKMDKVHGLAEFLPEGLKEKVWSIFPDVDYTNGIDQNGRLIGALHCVTKLELTAELTQQDMLELKDWWRGQLSDGWGEGFEYREIKVGNEELYVVPWSHDFDFYIDTQAEFDVRMGNVLPADALESAASDNNPLEAKIGMLKERFDANYESYHDTWVNGCTTHDLIEVAEHIVNIRRTHDYLINEHVYTEAEVDFLLKFKTPLDIISDRCGDPDDSFAKIIDSIMDTQDWTLSRARYELIADSAAKPSRYTSVMAHIRKSQEDKRNNPSAQKYAKNPKYNHGDDVL